MPLNKLNLFNHSIRNKESFIKNDWHKKPVLFKQVFTAQQLSILPNKQQLIDLSCNEDIQSRIVFKNSETQYQIEVGPFEKEDFQNIDEHTWNLLISDVDKWCPETGQLLQYFDFIRNWIFDDIMISTGSIEGTVGPHTDHYDVFLIQVSGQRQWQFGHHKIYDPTLLSDAELKLLNDFTADESYILNPGDVLYLPPEVAHYGIAKSDDCVTCSIGMRTPSHSELITDFIDDIAQNLSDNNRFEEPKFKQQPKRGEITAQDIENIKKILIENINTSNTEDINNWFGKYISSYRNIFHEFSQSKESCNLKQKQGFTLNSFAKACYLIDGKQTKLFINGDQYTCSLKFAQLVCNDKQLNQQTVSKLNAEDKETLVDLYKNGAIE